MIEAAYIHIPFCNHICNYCDFAKMLYQKKWAKNYLKALEREINKYYQGETLKTIYIGGGTPTALDLEELEQLFKITQIFKRDKNCELTIECNIESLTEDKMQCMKQYGVNRISIGIETFHPHHLKNINRHHTKEQVISAIANLKKDGFQNINVDLMYALPNETVAEVKKDIEEIVKLDIPHISTYSLIIEPNTPFYLSRLQPIEEELDAKMYETICTILKKHGYLHYEISNFAKEGYASKHNLTYWNNAFYYGFGLGASGYIPEVRYTNTRSLTNYCNGFFQLEQEKIDNKTKMENEMILGLRKLEGVNILQFEHKYQKKIETVFPIQKLKKEGKLNIRNGQVQIPEKQLYLSNDILIEFLN